MDRVTYASPRGDPATERCVYRGEGNAHLALALPDSGRVLRIKKSSGTTDDGDERRADWKRDLRFYREIVMPLLGPFVDDVEPVRVAREEIERLEKVLEPVRPSSRKHKRLRWDHTTLFADHTRLPDSANLSSCTYSVEIKPKLGFVTSASGRCAFCDKQNVKLAAGKIRSITSYCPLDLFSCDERRMRKAILALLENPQNNLRIFKDGELCYGESFDCEQLTGVLSEMFDGNGGNVLEAFCTLIIRVLLQERVDNHACEQCLVEPLYDLTQKPVPSCVLGRILSLQRLDPTGRHLDSSSNGGYSYVDRYLHDVHTDSNRCPRCVMRRYVELRNRRIMHETHLEFLETLVRSKDNRVDRHREVDLFIELSDGLWDFGGRKASEVEKLRRMAVDEWDENGELVGDHYNSVPHYMYKIAKDCSVMVTARRIDEVLNNQLCNSSECDRVQIGGCSFAVDAKVIDLYPKREKGKTD